MGASFRELLPYGLLLMASVIGVVQYCIIIAEGQALDSITSYYNISKKDGDNLYSATNFGACAMSFVAGLMFDYWGPLRSCIVATIAGVLPPLFQLSWGAAVPGPSAMFTLALCYMVFGFGSTTFNIVGCFAPLAGFSEGNIGKANLLVQVSISVGISYQSWAFDQARGDDETASFFPIYLAYIAAFTALTGLVSYSGLYAFCASANTATLEPSCEPPHTSLLQQLRCWQFAWMSLLFSGSVAFGFSFLDYESKIATAVGYEMGPLLKIFGLLDAVARVAVNSPLDYTKNYRFGGPIAFISISLFVFSAGLLWLVVPSSPGVWHLQVANALVALGYGGMMGMVTAALRLQFGTEHMGALCGVLYVMVSVAQPLWGLLTEDADCFGVGCYRQYCAVGAATMVATAAAGLALLMSSPHPSLDSKKVPLLLVEEKL